MKDTVLPTFNQRGFVKLCRSVGLDNFSESIYHDLLTRYSEPHRHYHDARHIDQCLQEFDAARGTALNPVALEWAIWFHDIVYDPKGSDNEERSAKYARECLQQVSPELAGQVSDLILTTKTHLPGAVPDAPLLIDIDLSILGKSPERFAEYETEIRKEYVWVPMNVYCGKRVEILRGFLSSKRIYRTKSFHDRYEDAARRNISKLISELRREV